MASVGMTSAVRGLSRICPAWPRVCITKSPMNALPLMAQAAKHVSDIASFMTPVLDGSPFGGSSSRGQRQRRGEDVVHPLKVSLEYLYNRTSKKLYLSRSVLYSKCKGKGSKSGASMKCAGYQGSGMKVNQASWSIYDLANGTFINECKGTKETINDKDRSTQCKGEKVVLEKKVLEVHVEKRIQNEQKKRVPLYPFEAVYEVLHFYVVTLLIFQFFLVTDDMKLLDGWLFLVDILAHSTDA
ncbi:DnaJ protein [Tanacetum coccineum]